MTQKPMENTVEDLWRMLLEFKCPVLVSFSDETDTDQVDNQTSMLFRKFTFNDFSK